MWNCIALIFLLVRLRICSLYLLLMGEIPSKKSDLVVRVWFWEVWSHFFTAITLGSTLTHCGCTCESPIYGSDRSVWKFIFDRTVCKKQSHTQKMNTECNSLTSLDDLLLKAINQHWNEIYLQIWIFEKDFFSSTNLECFFF